MLLFNISHPKFFFMYIISELYMYSNTFLHFGNKGRFTYSTSKKPSPGFFLIVIFKHILCIDTVLMLNAIAYYFKILILT